MKMKKLLLSTFVIATLITPVVVSATCMPPSQYPGQCISQSDLNSKNLACQKSGNSSSLACTEAKACEASLSIYLSDSANYFNCKAAEEKAAADQAANAAAKAEADRIQNEQNQFTQAEYNSCQNKLVANFEVVDHVCRCKAGYSGLNNVCTEVNAICATWFGEGGYSTSKTDATCACKDGYVLSGKSCVVKPVQAVISSPVIPTSPVLPPPVTQPVVKKEIPIAKPVLKTTPKLETPVVATTTIATTTMSTSSVIKEPLAVAPVLAVEPKKTTEIPKENFVKRIWKALFSWW
jgi:hypothetical protein